MGPGVNNLIERPLDRVADEAPFFPRCSDNKTAARVRPREYALKYPYMQVNRPGMVSWLVFDLDHSNSWIWDDEGLPAPNIVVTNRGNGKSHLFYAIIPVCTGENARSKPIRYMKAVYEAFASKLDADPSYSGPVAKTPGHRWWKTSELHSKVYELGELADYVDLPAKPYWNEGPNIELVSHSRHCILFEELRHYAYSIVNRERENGSYSKFLRFIEAYALSRNKFKHRGFSMDLTVSQVQATVKSIARWTWDRYSGSSRCNLGVMQLDKTLPLSERQRLSARRTHQERVKSTENKIRAAYLILQEKGVKPSFVALSKQSGLCRQAVAKYKELIEQLSAITISENVINLPSEAQETPKNKNVNFGVRQIAAGFSAIDILDGVQSVRITPAKYRKPKIKPPD